LVWTPGTSCCWAGWLAVSPVTRPLRQHG